MKEIQLTRGKVTSVDDEDYEYLSQWKWQAHRAGYACRSKIINGKKETFQMHREIMGCSGKVQIDHKDRNRFNNQKENLRVCTSLENSRNRTSQKHSTSKYLGVCWNKKANKWIAYITSNVKSKHLGYFKVEKEAAIAYNNAAVEYFGEFANLNIIDEDVFFDKNVSRYEL